MRKLDKKSKDEFRNEDVALVGHNGEPMTNLMVDDIERRYASGDIPSEGWAPVRYGPGMPDGMSKREWRQYLQAPPMAAGRPPLASGEPSDVVSFKMPRSLVAYVKRAAQACGQTKSRFIREAVLEKARRVLEVGQ